MMLKAYVVLIIGVAAFGVAAIGVPSAHAQEVLTTHDDWTSYAYQEKDQRVCYIASRPAKQEGTFKKRGEPYVMVTRRGSGKDATEEVAISAGYPYKEDTKVEVVIGTTQFNLFSQDQWAWAPNAAGDKEIVGAMVRGFSMTVRAESRVGTNSIDTYSLKGFSAARKAIAEACG